MSPAERQRCRENIARQISEAEAHARRHERLIADARAQAEALRALLATLTAA